MKCVKVRVWGRVQGVGFRYFVYQKAKSLGLFGWVKNNNDLSVSILMQGDENEVKTLLDLVKSGPKLAQVQNVEVEFLPSDSTLGEFSIVR